MKMRSASSNSSFRRTVRGAGARLERNPVFARLNAFHVDPQLVANFDTIFGGAAGLVRNPRACHECLSRNSARAR